MKAECDIFNQVRGLWAGHALLAAQELGILDLLWRSGLSADQIAKRLSLDAHGVGALFAALRDIGIVETKDGANSLTLCGREAADPNGSISGYLAFHAMLRRSWAELPDLVRQGVHGEFEPNRSDSPELVKAYIKAMDALGKPIADDLAKALDIKPSQTVLDLGGGSSVNAQAILTQQPQAHVTLMDRPIVIRLLQESLLITSPKNLTLAEGDYLNLKVQQQYDLVLLANIIHNEGPTDIACILNSCSMALTPGGRLAILDYFTDLPLNAGAGPAGFEMLLYLITSHGRVYSHDNLISMTTEAGFVKPDIAQVGPYCLAVFERDGGGV